jgi:hypothetical protein
MNKTTDPSAPPLPATRPIGLTSGSLAATRKDTTMTDEQIRSAFENLLRLHSSTGEAVAQFSAIGAIREVIFRPGGLIFVAYERDARDAQRAVELLGDPAASALIEEMVNLTQRMIQVEAALPPARPYSRDLNNPQLDDSATIEPIAPPAAELNLAGLGLYLGSGTLWNYLGRTVSRPELQGMNLYVLSQPELMDWCKWNGDSPNGDIEVVIGKVTQYLATLCRVTNDRR